MAALRLRMAWHRRRLQASPLLERLKARGYEVLYLRDPVDEWTFQSLADYRSIRFQDIAKEGLQLPGENHEEDEVKFAPLIEWLKETLDRFIDDVRISTRLTTSACTLLASQYGATGNMERIMRAQAYQQGLDTQVNVWETMRKVRSPPRNKPAGAGSSARLPNSA